MRSLDQPLVYVLTPVYNGEKYLSECIASVLAQNYANWEYCILNNHSTDSSRVIAEAYAQRDRRIRVLDTPQFCNHLTSQNFGLRQMPADAQYCKIVHADDWLFADCLTQMVGLAEAHPTVAIVGAYGLRNDHVSWDGLPYGRSAIPGRDICRNTLFGGTYVFGSPTSLLFRAEPVRQRPAFFNESNPHADVEVCFDILRSGDFGFVHQVLTFTRDHSESGTHYTRRIGSDYLGMFEILLKYGRAFLTESEYDGRLKDNWNQYYAFLGATVASGSFDKSFRHFHRRGLNRLGCSLNPARLATAVLLQVIDLVLNPLTTSKRITRRLTRLLGNTSIRAGNRWRFTSGLRAWLL
ncbi:hypothetical protein YTPLAS18_18420 [Nitrospira sp.]|nr:hypothetical protein YTPLAS18_18420 [Nitrospira sp.]